MNEKNARVTANVILAAAAAGAAFVVFRNPKLRRMAWRLAKQYASGPLAGWAATTVRSAWNEPASLK